MAGSEGAGTRQRVLATRRTWFGIATRQSIRRGTFTNVKVLIKQIRDYITHWNTAAKPFTWTATADEILAKVRLVQANIKSNWSGGWFGVSCAVMAFVGRQCFGAAADV